ncbi:helix-turn-helix transcriptional regulator [Thiopseudomonas alkaliphila]|uniref:helix-turn-helix transcriptional regulator n=1 Tax=Thiopseudomonas alkaliphila TaxID=1697053 RepID=UPI0035716AEC
MRLISIKEVMHKTSLAKSTIYKYISEGRFPKSAPLSASKVAWLESEVDEWIEEMLKQR